MENKNTERIYFIPGNLVILKHNIDNKPVMLVIEVVTSRINMYSNSQSSIPTPVWGGINSMLPPQVETKTVNRFIGIRCGWFDVNKIWHEQIFSTKDLIKVEEGE